MNEEKRFRKLAYHEAGHLIINVAINLLDPVAYEVVRFNKSVAIWIDLEVDKGEVANSGFPTDTENISEYLLGKYNIEGIGAERFYCDNPNFAILNSLELMAGHVFEGYFNRNERLCTYCFGREYGERDDFQQFKRVFTYLMNSEEQTPLYAQEFEEKSIMLRNELVKLCDLKEVKCATKIIVDRLKEKLDELAPRVEISENNFEKLYTDLRTVLADVDLRIAIDKFLL